MSNIPNITEFCEQCGNLVELPIHFDVIDCQICKFKKNALDFKNEPTVTKIVYNQRKPWLDDYLSQDDQKVNLQRRAKINMQCDKCGNEEMYFWTLQLRSADEGSTVYYECVKCKHRYTVNN